MLMIVVIGAADNAAAAAVTAHDDDDDADDEDVDDEDVDDDVDNDADDGSTYPQELHTKPSPFYPEDQQPCVCICRRSADSGGRLDIARTHKIHIHTTSS